MELNEEESTLVIGQNQDLKKSQLHEHIDHVISESGTTSIIFSYTAQTLPFSLHPLELDFLLLATQAGPDRYIYMFQLDFKKKMKLHFIFQLQSLILDGVKRMFYLTVYQKQIRRNWGKDTQRLHIYGINQIHRTPLLCPLIFLFLVSLVLAEGQTFLNNWGRISLVLPEGIGMVVV